MLVARRNAVENGGVEGRWQTGSGCGTCPDLVGIRRLVLVVNPEPIG